MLSPIVLFVYNRPEHTAKTLHALKNNILAAESNLYIYSDAPKNPSAKKNVDAVRELISDVSGFKNVKVILQKENVGLANSIINGVKDVIMKYGKVIVLEDDLITSTYFIKFMNDALNHYKDSNDVWHISGWNYPILSDDLPDTFLWRTMNCWGWATWSYNWEFFEKNTDKLIQNFNKKDIKRFNLDGYENFWLQVLNNKNHKIDTWAIYWYATIFQNNGLCLNPSVSFVKNIGLDGTGQHCGNRNSFDSILSCKKDVNFTDVYIENIKAVYRIKLFYKNIRKTFFYKLKNKITKILNIKVILK